MNYACAEPDNTILHFERAMRLSPRDPEISFMLGGIAMAHLIAGRNADSLSFSQKSIDEMPGFTSSHRIKIASLVGLGRLQDARAAVAGVSDLRPRLHHFRAVAALSRRGFPAKILRRVEGSRPV